MLILAVDEAGVGDGEHGVGLAVGAGLSSAVPVSVAGPTVRVPG